MKLLMLFTLCFFFLSCSGSVGPGAPTGTAPQRSVPLPNGSPAAPAPVTPQAAGAAPAAVTPPVPVPYTQAPPPNGWRGAGLPFPQVCFAADGAWHQLLEDNGQLHLWPSPTACECNFFGTNAVCALSVCGMPKEIVCTLCPSPRYGPSTGTCPTTQGLQGLH